MHPAWIEITAENLCTPLPIQNLFPQNLPLEIDLGAGDGTFSILSASTLPSINFLAIERLKGRALKIAKKSSAASLPNLRVLRIDALYALQYLIPPACVSGLHLLFPDPWPKRKHQKHRLLQPPFLLALKKILRPYGFFHFATDDTPYWKQGNLLLSSDPSFVPTPPLRNTPPTDFEQLWIQKGKSPHHGWWFLRP